MCLPSLVLATVGSLSFDLRTVCADCIYAAANYWERESKLKVITNLLSHYYGTKTLAVFRLYLDRFSYDIKHVVPGKELYTAGTFSRAPLALERIDRLTSHVLVVP